MRESKRTVLDSGIAAIVCLVVECVVLVLTVVGTPIAQFRPSGVSSSCITLWGYKMDCGSTKYTARGISAFGCGQAKNNMTAAAAFSIMAIVVILFTILWALLRVARLVYVVWMLPILSIVGGFLLLVCWACVAGVYTIPMCGFDSAGRRSYHALGYNYGAGFGLMVAAWVLQCLLVIFLFISMFM